MPVVDICIRFEPAECECDDPTCPHLHSPGWWVDNVSFATKQEAEAYFATLGERPIKLFENKYVPTED